MVAVYEWGRERSGGRGRAAVEESAVPACVE